MELTDYDPMRAFNVDDRVMTIDGIAGRVTAVLDGIMGVDHVEVVLDRGLGGGTYGSNQLSMIRSSHGDQLTANASRTVAVEQHEAVGPHLASEYYPELAAILRERPPLENEPVTTFVGMASLHGTTAMQHTAMPWINNDRHGRETAEAVGAKSVRAAGFKGFVGPSDYHEQLEDMGHEDEDHEDGGFDEDLHDQTRPEPTHEERAHEAEHGDLPDSYYDRHDQAYSHALDQKQHAAAEDDRLDHEDDHLSHFVREHGDDADEWRKHSAQPQHINISGGVYATQSHVAQKHIDKYLADPHAMSDHEEKYGPGSGGGYLGNEHPMFVTHEGRLHATEGHHRTAAALQRGDTHIWGWHHNLDEHPVAKDYHGDDCEDCQYHHEDSHHNASLHVAGQGDPAPATPPCAFCGSTQFDPDLFDTGRGARITCSQCGGTMVSTDGGMWQPDPPSATQNHMSDQGDPRARVEGEVQTLTTRGGLDVEDFGETVMARFDAAQAGAKRGQSLTWDQIGERHPDVYGHGNDDGEQIGDAAAYLAFDRPGHSFDNEEEYKSGHDLTFHHEVVNPDHIDYNHHQEWNDPRVQHAYQGYRDAPQDVPPLVLVHRHGIYHVADGHHRARAAAQSSRMPQAYVAYSPHDDEPFANGHEGASYGAEHSEGNAENRAAQMRIHHTSSLTATAAHEADFRWHVLASWADVRDKAKRIRAEGGVRILAVSADTVVGEVQGDNAIYESQVNYVPGRRSLGFWSCSCKWGAYAWGRSPAYIRFEGRRCSHVAALQFEAQARGMFGRQVTEDAGRLPGQFQRTPVVVHTERGTHDESRRRTVPPGNMRRTYNLVTEAGRDSNDYRFGYGHGLTGQEGNRPHFQKKLDAGRELDEMDQDYLAGHAAGTTESQRREQQRTENGQHRCPDCRGSGDGGFGRTCRGCDGTGAISHEQATTVDKLYHVTDNPHFSPDAHHVPEDNAISMSVRDHPGLFAASADGVSHWTRAKNYVRPYVAEIHVPRIAHEPGRWGGERFIPGENLDQAKVHRIIPLAAHEDETYDGKPYTGPDARDMTPDEHAVHKQHALDQLGEQGFDENERHEVSKHWASLQPDDGIAPIHVFAAEMIRNDDSLDAVLQMVGAYGVDTAQAAQIVAWAAQEAHTGFPEGMAPGSDIPRMDKRDHSGEDKRKNPKHHTQDARRNAPNFGVGINPGAYPWLAWCPQCAGSGCGHCAGTGQVINSQTMPTTGPADLSMTTTPVAGQNDDAGDGVGSTVGMRVEADSTMQQWPGGTASDGWKKTPHSETQNPADTGWASSEDPESWEKWIPNPQGSDGIGSTVAVAQGNDGPTVSGIALKAADTGRILMLQRGLEDEKDPARGTWEFPGGHHEDGDLTSLHAGIREWQEEVGQEFPEGGHVAHTWRNGPYQGHLVVIPEESALRFKDGRSTVNPDDSGGDHHEQAAWWDPEHARKNPALREECKNSPWAKIKGADMSTTARLVTFDDLHELSDQFVAQSPYGNARDALTAVYVAQEPELARQGLFDDLWTVTADLHDGPEPALPSTDGGNDTDDLMLDNRTVPWGYDPAQFGMEQQSQATPDQVQMEQQRRQNEQELAATGGLQTIAAANFSYHEQRELIGEGGRSVRPRTLADLQISGTHYATIGDDDPIDGDDEFLLA